MTTAEHEAMASNEDTNRCDDILDTGQFTDIADVYESDHMSYESEEDEDEETSEKDVEALYNDLSIYEFQLDKERFTELEKMLAECDDVIKESDYHVTSLESFKKTISLTFSDSDEDDAEDLELLEICGSETFKVDNNDQTNDMVNEQLFLTEGPTENSTDEKEVVGDEIIPTIANRISDLTKLLQLQLTETDDTYERLLGEQSRRYKEMNDNSDRLDSERKENLAQFEKEKAQHQHVKEAKAAAMCQWEEDHQNQLKDELETQQSHIQKLEEFMEKERETADILTQIQQEEQKKREIKSAIKIQSIVRMIRMRKQYRIILEKNKLDEEEKAKQEERKKAEEEKEKEKRRKEEERIKREKEEERKNKEIERRKREEEEKKAEEERIKKVEEERKKRDDEEKKKREEEERKKREEEERKKREEEERKKREEEEKKRQEEEGKKIEEQERKKREEEKKRKKEEERRKREAEEKIKREEEERQKIEKEKLKEEEERKRKEEDDRVKREKEERRKREEEEREKREERERKKREEEEKNKKEEGGEKREKKEEKQCEKGRSRSDEGEEERRKEEKGVKIEEGVKRKREEEKRKEVECVRCSKKKEEKEEEKVLEEKEKEKEKREAEEEKEEEILQKGEKEVQKKTEKEIKERKNVAVIENVSDSKMANFYTEMRPSIDVEMKNSKNKADDKRLIHRESSGCDKNAGDEKQTIKEGVQLNKEREGGCEKEREKEKEERNEEVRSERNGERRKELKPEVESVLSWKMEGSHDVKKRDLKSIDEVSVTSAPSEDQQEMNAVTKTEKVQETYLQPLRHTLNVRRLAWMENCLPWGKISNQPWIGDKKNHALKKSEKKRPPSKKRLPNPISEAVILSATKYSSLTQVTSVHLMNLNAFTLTTLGQCPHLQYLSVNNCQLLTLDGLQGCSQLRYIDVKNNNVEYVNVKDMGNLQILDLSHNNLALIHGLEECSNLLWLNLQHNRITKLGFGLGSLRRLHTLLLGHNQLISTSGLQDGGAELQTLDISHNQLQYVTDIEKLCLLRSLDVSCNNLLQTPKLTNHVLMQELYLSDNCLSSLIELSECWLPLLRILNLGQNRFSSVPPMEYVHSLKMIDIRNNQVLDSVELLKALSNCERLEQVLLEGNPLSQEQNIREQMTKAFLHLRYLDWGCSSSSDPCQLEENPLTSSSKISAENGFDRICADQTEVFENLESEFQQKVKSLSERPPLDLSGLCNTYVKWCQKSLRIAVECRYAHEYGDTSFSKLVAVDESMEQERESTSTLTNTENTQTIAKMTSPETYRNTSCQTAEKSQDSCSKGQASEAHLDRSGHDHSVIAAPGFIAAQQEHATTASATTASAVAVSAKHSEIRLLTKPEVPKEDCDQNQTVRSNNFRNSKESDALLATRNKAATRIQALWRGFCLRVKLHAALEFAQNIYEEESEFGEEIDLTSFDMAEADLEKTWTVSDTPTLPMNFPVLGRPPPSRSSSRHQLRLPKSQDENRLNQENSPSPAHPRLAWNTPDVSARSIQPINGAPRLKGPEVLRLSPPPTSAASGTREGDLPALVSRRKDDEICKEWGFKDARTAQLMLQRAKKMKFNAERREKLKKLDPHQRLALFRKLGEVIPVMPTKSPSRKMLPKKEYFQARQQNMGLNLGYFEMMSKEEETKIKESRTYQWIHTQITPFDNSDQKSQQSFSDKSISQSSKKSLNPSQRVILFQRPPVTSGGLWGAGTSEQSRSAMDNESEPSGESRRHSTPGSANRPVHLPPIDRSSVSTRHWGGSMSHWNPDVEKSGGWGGGRKRNKRKRSANVSDGH